MAQLQKKKALYIENRLMMRRELFPESEVLQTTN